MIAVLDYGVRKEKTKRISVNACEFVSLAGV